MDVLSHCLHHRRKRQEEEKHQKSESSVSAFDAPSVQAKFDRPEDPYTGETKSLQLMNVNEVRLKA